MYPQTHFLFPFFIALILTEFNLLSWKLALLAGTVGVLVDLDHYFEHIMHAKKNKFSLKDTWNNSIKLHKFYQRSFIHHWIGAVLIASILLAALFFNWKISLALAIGYYSHLILDHYHLKGKKLEIKIGPLFINEYHTEIILDAILIVLVFVLVGLI